MKEDYLDYSSHIADLGDMVKNKNNRKNYKIKKRNISFNIPLADVLSKEDIEKLKSIR